MRARRADGFGLASMRERLALVSGELTIDSQPGGGTRVCARAPMSTLPPLKRDSNIGLLDANLNDTLTAEIMGGK